jgi:hypothetical protein
MDGEPIREAVYSLFVPYKSSSNDIGSDKKYTPMMKILWSTTSMGGISVSSE